MGSSANVVSEVVGDAIIDPIKQGVRSLILRIDKIREFAADVVLSVVPKLVDAKTIPSPAGIQPELNSLKDLMGAIFQRTADLTVVVSEDAAEVLTEMVSEAFSNVAYSSVGGALDSVARIKSGAMPPQDFANEETTWDSSVKAIIDAMAGFTFHYTILTRIAREFAGLREDLLSDSFFQQFIETYRWANTPKVMILNMYGRMQESAILRVQESISAALEALFARAEDVANEWRAAYILYTNGKLSEAEYLVIEAKANAELDAIEQELDAILEDLAIAMQTLDIPKPAGITLLEQSVIGAIQDAENAVITDIQSIHEDLYKMRVNARPSGYKYVITINTSTHEITEPTTA